MDDTDHMVGGGDDIDFLEAEPSSKDKQEMRKANKRPSEWLRLLCRDWAAENDGLVEATDAKFMVYKPYLKGSLSSQLLCRLSIPPTKEMDTPIVDFWGICGIEDEFDKAYIIAQVERFCTLYNIRGNPYASVEETTVDPTLFDDHAATVAAAAAAANGTTLMPFMNDATAAAVAAAAAASSDVTKAGSLTKKQANEVSKAHRMAKDAEKALEQERRQNFKREQRRLSQERKEQKAREREQVAIRKAAERIARENSREERRRKKLELRLQREKFAQEQKEAALKRAAELVASNRVPIEITRGAAAAKAAANAALQQSGVVGSEEESLSGPPLKKSRSAIVVSTALDLHQIVTHSKNLWAKYNAIAKEHNQKVNWITVAKELGIHVKVREKYARMHSRAEQRGFDWQKHGHWKIKDHPDIFLEPTQAEQKAKMPPPPPDSSTTVLISEDNKEVPTSMPTDEAAVAAAAAVVDAAGVSGAAVGVPTHDDTTTAAAVAATLVADPTAPQDVDTHMI